VLGETFELLAGRAEQDFLEAHSTQDRPGDASVSANFADPNALAGTKAEAEKALGS
jgi:hypothetical protein